MLRRLLSAALVAATLPLAAQAQVVFDNGSPNADNGNEMTQWIQAEDFSLAGATNITGIRFWAFALSPTAYTGSIEWRIYSSTGTPGVDNTPDAVLFSGTWNGGFTNEGPLAYNGADQLRFDIATNVNLGAGTYWLGLHNGPFGANARQEFYWQTRAANGTRSGHEDIDPFDQGGWFSNGQEHAFQLLGNTTVVPEPSTYALLGTGLVALVVVARRRRTT